MTITMSPTAAPTAGVGLALVLTGLLMGCGSGETKKTSPDQMQDQMGKLDYPRPGQYARTMDITRLDIPAMDAEQIGQLRQMMERSRASTFCLTKEQSQEGFKAMFDRLGQNGACAYSRFHVAGGHLDAQMSCKGEGGSTASIKLSGLIAADGSNVVVAMDQKGLPKPATRVSMTMQMVSKRTGDCIR